jgi:hypothetical protein
VNKENDKILLIAIGNVLKNKYIHIVNDIVCVFQMSIIMQILSLYIITDKQKDVSHDVIMVKCYKFCYYLYIHVHRGIFLLSILPNFHYYAYYYKLQANIRLNVRHTAFMFIELSRDRSKRKKTKIISMG